MISIASLNWEHQSHHLSIGIIIIPQKPWETWETTRIEIEIITYQNNIQPLSQ